MTANELREVRSKADLAAKQLAYFSTVLIDQDFDVTITLPPRLQGKVIFVDGAVDGVDARKTQEVEL